MALTDNLICWFCMEEASGARVDAHAALNLTDNNNVLRAAGKVNFAADFVGASSQYLSRADGAGITVAGATDFTFAFWFNVDSIWVTDYLVTKWQGGGSNNDEFYIGWVNGKPTLGVRAPDNASQTAQWGSTLSNATWYLGFFWRDGSNIYVDINNSGTPVSSVWTKDQKDATVDFYVGRLGGTYLDGLIDELALWHRVLTSDERTEIWNGGDGLTYADLATGCVPQIMHLLRFRRNN